MTVEQMKRAIKIVYRSDKWWNKVDKMTDNQVIAVYNRMLEAGKIIGDGEVVGNDRTANRIYVNEKSHGKYVDKGFKDGIKNTNPHIVKKVEKLTSEIYSKQITFDDLWRNAGYSYVGTSKFMEGATSEDSSECSDDAFGEPRTDENT